MGFRDRREAGKRLAALVAQEVQAEDCVVLAIPRGGVVVAAEVAKALGAPLDICLARKIGAPGNGEFAVGSVTAHGPAVLDERVIRHLGIPSEYLEAEIVRQREEIARRAAEYRGGAPGAELRGQTVILVDDGLATGSTAIAALRALKEAGAWRRILAVPIAPAETIRRMAGEAEQVITVEVSNHFRAVGQFYERFDQLSDEEVIAALGEVRRTHPY